MKICKAKDCNNPVFGGGYCKWHQSLRTDKKKSKKIVYKPKKAVECNGFTCESEMFEHIWNTRPHKSELTGEKLLPKDHPQWHWQFLHVLSKGAYPSYRLNPKNIILALPDEHEKQEEYEYFNKRKQELKLQYYTNNDSN